MNVRLLLFLFLPGLLAGCANDDELKTEDTREISLFVASSVATETFGLNALIQETAEIQASVNGRTSVCDYTDTGEYSVSNELASNTTFNYDYNYSVGVSCTEQVPTHVDVTFAYSGEFDGPELAWVHEGNGDFDVTPAGDNLAYNGTYDRGGNYEWKNFDRAGSSDVQLSFSNVLVSAGDKSIISGSGTFEISVTRPQRTFNASGTIIFNGDNTATIKFENNIITFNTTNGSRI